MKISLNWLKEFVDIDLSPERLSDVLVAAGLEVESVSRLGEGLDNVVVAKILSMRPHPNADRLTLCSVTTGDKEHAIVCGAKNMKEGDHVALALPGAHLPNGMKISKSKIRGEVSEGMLCSEVELGLARDSAGIMIIPEDVRPGEQLAEALALNDTVFEINITPNRSDCLSVIGIAREIAALTGKALNRPDVRFSEGEFETSSCASVDVRDADGCPRYTARAVKGVKVGPSPMWLRKRLESADVRPINNVVDITNYVMLETGQPLHAFDLNLLSGKKIVVRRASPGERITTLDGAEKALDGETLVICDSERPVAVAGVIGGEGSGILEGTSDVLIESAYFNPSLVRKAAKRHGLNTESSYRFERGVDPNGVLHAANRAVQMILGLAGGTASSRPIDVYPKKAEPAAIEMRLDRVSTILGVDTNAEFIVDSLTRLGFAVDRPDTGRLKVSPPTFRVDVSREIDLIEEVARLRGYDTIPVTYPRFEAKGGERNESRLLKDRISGMLAGMGFCEAVTYGFVSPEDLAHFLPSGTEPLRLRNPLSEEQSVMRTTLIPSLLGVVGRNISHQNENLRLFEAGMVFPSAGEEKGERTVVCGVMTGIRHGKAWNLSSEALDFFDIKGVVENLLEGAGVSASFAPAADIGYLHPGKSAVIRIDDLDAGFVGEIHPGVLEAFDVRGAVYAFEVELGVILDAVRSVSFTHIPKFPAVYRDIALVVDNDIPAEKIYRLIKGADPLVENVVLFDLYQGKPVPDGKKSMAFSIIYRAQDRTLRDEEINAVHERVVNTAKETVGGVLREQGGL